MTGEPLVGFEPTTAYLSNIPPSWVISDLAGRGTAFPPDWPSRTTSPPKVIVLQPYIQPEHISTIVNRVMAGIRCAA